MTGENPAKGVCVNNRFKNSSAHPGHMMMDSDIRKPVVDTAPRFGLKNHLIKINENCYEVGATQLTRRQCIQRGLISNEPLSFRSRPLN